MGEEAIEFRKLMNNVCVKTGWSELEAYEKWMSDIYDIIYRDFEYFPEGPSDSKKDFENKRRMLRG